MNIHVLRQSTLEMRKRSRRTTTKWNLHVTRQSTSEYQLHGEWAVGQSSLFHAQFTGSPPRLQLGESRLNGCLGSIWQGSLRSWDLVQQHVQHAHLPFLGLSQQWLWSTWPPWFDNQQRSPWAQVVYPRPAGEERGKRKGEQNSRGKTSSAAKENLKP